MSSENDLDELFSNEVDVAPSRAANPRLLQVVLALVGVGLLIGVVVVVIVSSLSSVAPQVAAPGSIDCGGAVCTDLTLDQVRSLTALNLPDETEVVTSSYAETDDLITVAVELILPDGADPFTDTGYGEISAPTLDWATDDLDVLGYFAATGADGALNAEAVHAINDRVREVVLVQVTRTLE